MSYDALRALASQTSEVSETSEVSLDTDLWDLVARGLLHHDRRAARYNLHPIVRRYAYDRLRPALSARPPTATYGTILPPCRRRSGCSAWRT